MWFKFGDKVVNQSMKKKPVGVFSKLSGLRASVPFFLLPHPLPSTFLLSPHFSRLLEMWNFVRFVRERLLRRLHLRVIVTFESKEGEVVLVAGWWRQRIRCSSLDSRWQIQVRPYSITEWWCERVLQGKVRQISADYTYSSVSGPRKHRLGSPQNIS